MGMRIGHGYDVHAMEAGDGIRLGGVDIDCEFRLIAHSDGDVALHALSDALLGALALGDIGQHFPDTDERYRGADSVTLLRAVYDLVQARGYELVNADITIIAQKPKLAAYRQAMQAAIADALHCSSQQIGIKATTSEKLGFTGRSEGIAVHAVVLVECP